MSLTRAGVDAKERYNRVEINGDALSSTHQYLGEEVLEKPKENKREIYPESIKLHPGQTIFQTLHH